MNWKYRKIRREIFLKIITHIRYNKKLSKERFIELVELFGEKFDSDNTLSFCKGIYDLDGAIVGTYDSIEWIPRKNKLSKKAMKYFMKNRPLSPINE